MHLCSIKNEQATRFQDFLFKLATELCEDYIIKRSSKNANIARPQSLSPAYKKKTKARSVNSVK